MINYYLGLGTGLFCGFVWGYILFYEKEKTIEEKKQKMIDDLVNIYSKKHNL